MAPLTDSFDLGALHLSSGEGRRIELHVAIEPFTLADERYPVEPAVVPVRLDVSRTTGEGYALRLRFTATLAGPCMRCLQAATPSFEVEAREVSQPAQASDELASPYLDHGVLDLSSWVRDSLAVTLPTKLLCRPECAGLCPVCGTDLNTAPADHQHEREPDPRWAKLSELRFE